MATLTEEQRRRIEENKRKALARRAEKLSQTSQASQSSWNGSQPSWSGSTISPPALPVSNVSMAQPNVMNTNTNSFKSNQSFPKLDIFTSTNKSDNVNPTFQNSGSSNFPSYKSSNVQNLQSPATAVNKVTKPDVTVSFALRSRDRFNVDASQFNKFIIEILKTIPGKLFDPKTNQWHFPLASYQQCKKALEESKKCLIQPLPPYILRVFFQERKMDTDYKTIDLSRIDRCLSSSLYPFQKEGVQFGISKNGRCIIADDMGLGKTIQGLGIAHYYFNDWPLLIVCPSSMRYQWEEEVRNYLPKVPVTKIFIQSKIKDQINNPLVLITTYDLMAKCEAQLMAMRFGVIILDESHSIKNLSAQRTKAALNLIAKATRCVLLSGTPALSRPVELYAQMKAVDPKIPSLKDYGVRYCDAKQTYFGWDYTGSKNMEELKILLEEHFMIRRLKSAVLHQLPSKIRQVVILDKEEVKINKKVKSKCTEKLDDTTTKANERRNKLLEYYGETAHMKIEAIKKYVSQLLEAGNKFLVFCHHKVVMDAVSDLLEKNKTHYIRIDGNVNSEERKSVCDQFQTEDKFRVAVLSITAASTGLTLTAANLVIFAELFWNPGILTQAEDRVHRIGQQDSVLVQYLVAAGTADDYMWPLIKEKLNILNQAGLSKDNFSCERTSVKSTNEEKSILDYFDDSEEFDADLSQCAEAIEEIESKRARLNDSVS